MKYKHSALFALMLATAAVMSTSALHAADATAPAPNTEAAPAAPLVVETDPEAAAALNDYATYETALVVVSKRKEPEVKALWEKAHDNDRRALYGKIGHIARKDPAAALRLAHEYEDRLRQDKDFAPVAGVPDLVALYRQHEPLRYYQHHATPDELLALPVKPSQYAFITRAVRLDGEARTAFIAQLSEKYQHAGVDHRLYVEWFTAKVRAAEISDGITLLEAEIKSLALTPKSDRRDRALEGYLTTLAVLKEIAGYTPPADNDTASLSKEQAALRERIAIRTATRRQAGIVHAPAAAHKYSPLYFWDLDLTQKEETQGLAAVATERAQYYRAAAAVAKK